MLPRESVPQPGEVVFLHVAANGKTYRSIAPATTFSKQTRKVKSHGPYAVLDDTDVAAFIARGWRVNSRKVRVI